MMFKKSPFSDMDVIRIRKEGIIARSTQSMAVSPERVGRVELSMPIFEF